MKQENKGLRGIVFGVTKQKEVLKKYSDHYHIITKILKKDGRIIRSTVAPIKYHHIYGNLTVINYEIDDTPVEYFTMSLFGKISPKQLYKGTITLLVEE